ncbi:MAG: M20/M25/M40 family metallo-hydrolase [Bryobacteraceae bacterium]
MLTDTQPQLIDHVESNQNRLFTLIGDLVRRNSENMPPAGREGECQQYIASVLERAGWQPDLYELDSVQGLQDHPLYYGGRNYTGRPNLGARRKGTGGGRSLILSGHIDTVPRGTQPWTRDAFGGQIEGNRLYGRGSNDMKAGVGVNLFIAEALQTLGLRLAGDLIFETVIDEEFGGVNGTLAGRLRGYIADAAVISEPSFLRICAAQRGGRTAHITFSGAGGVLSEGQYPAGVVDQVTYFLGQVKNFGDQRRGAVRPHPLYAHHPDHVPVSITKIFTAPWGTREPITTPEECKIEMYWQAMPGETKADIEREFFAWFDHVVASAPRLFANKPKVEFPIRWLPGSAISASEPLVTTLAASATSVLGQAPPIVGIEGPCDMYVFHGFRIPAVLWGPRGGNTHAADEYVELDTVVAAAKALLLFVCNWCGVA